jgi:ATP-binding cassette subfamily F protein 3
MTQLAVSGASVSFGATTVFEDVTFTVGEGERWGIIGRNGTGKTTLFRVLTGEIAPSSGAIARTPGLRVSLLEQHRDFGAAETVWDAVADAMVELRALERWLSDQAEEIAQHGEQVTPQLLARYARDLERFEHEGGYELASRVDAVLHGLGFDHEEARHRPLSHLSGGERGRVGLARQLVAPADVMLLDEPTNHLDLETTRWLEDYLLNSSATVLLVSHDRAFLAAVADHVLHFDDGSATAYVGGYEAFIAQRAERRLSQQRAFDKQRRVIADEQDYIRRNIAGQNTKQAKGRRKRLDRLPRLSPPPGEAGTMALRFEPRDRGGDQVVVAEGARVSLGKRLLVNNFTGHVRRGDRVGIIGPNGTGKSTFLRALLGDVPLASGSLRVGASTTVAHYRQDMAQVPLTGTLYEIINELRPQWERGQIQGHLGRFGFSGDEVLRRADSLSGGERARVALAMMMLSGANLLLFDEPTNHLDVESIEALEDAIEQYAGTVIIVSHDRALLRALVARVWELRDGTMTVFDGEFAEWEVVAEARRATVAAETAGVNAQRRARARETTDRREHAAKEQREALRRARRAVEASEAEAAACEARVASIMDALSEPALYATPNGSDEAARLGGQLETAKAAFERALEAWSRAIERAEALSATE